jgi:ketosteroid isomerase-like protein
MKQSWYDELFGIIDNRQVESFLNLVTDDITFTVANHPPVVGKDAVRDMLAAFWSSINGLKHTFRNVFECQDHTIFEFMVRYTRTDNEEVSVPCVTIIRLRDGRVSDWRIYIDMAPVFSPG